MEDSKFKIFIIYGVREHTLVISNDYFTLQDNRHIEMDEVTCELDLEYTPDLLPKYRELHNLIYGEDNGENDEKWKYNGKWSRKQSSEK